MDVKLQCSRCGQESEVRDLNLFRITVPCLRCGYVNSIAQMLQNVYGSTVGKVAHAALKGLTGIKTNVPAEKGVTLLNKAERAILQAVDLSV